MRGVPLMNYELMGLLAMVSVLIAAAACMGIHRICQWFARREIIVDPHTPGAFIRRQDVAEEDYNDWTN